MGILALTQIATCPGQLQVGKKQTKVSSFHDLLGAAQITIWSTQKSCRRCHHHIRGEKRPPISRHLDLVVWVTHFGAVYDCFPRWTEHEMGMLKNTGSSVSFPPRGIHFFHPLLSCVHKKDREKKSTLSIIARTRWVSSDSVCQAGLFRPKQAAEKSRTALRNAISACANIVKIVGSVNRCRHTFFT